MQAYLQPGWQGTLPDYEDPAPAPEPRAVAPGGAIDRTAKIYVGGRQVRPDSGYSRAVVAHDGLLIGEVGDGNRKDIRNAVEAARKAESWGLTTAHLRAQILYYVAENLDVRRAEFRDRLCQMTGASRATATKEVTAAVARIFTYAA